ncbi:MAG: hypothetical protein SGILL_001158, partial [Bacillariaceae sp.]
PHHYLSFLEYQTLLSNMSQVAQLDTASPVMMRSSFLLDRTMNSLPIPVSYMDIDSDTDLQHQDDDNESYKSIRHLNEVPSSGDVKQYLDAPTAAIQ